MPRAVLWAALIALVAGSGMVAAVPVPTAQPPGAAIPEPFPFSDRCPAEVILRSSRDLDALLARDVDVGGIAALDGRAWRTGQPFRPQIATVYVTDAEAAELAALGLDARPVANESLRAWRLYGPGTAPPTGWPTFDQWAARMQALAAAHPDIVRLVSVGRSVQGRDLWALKLTDQPDTAEDEPELRYLSTLHGPEAVGAELTLRLAELLAGGYGTDPALTALVNQLEIWLLPLCNPDGYMAGSRYNAHGVDLNRDYPDRITDPVDDPAGREPDTQALMRWSYGRRFVMGANYHTGVRVVNYPWDSVNPGDPDLAPDDELFHTFSAGYAGRNPAFGTPQFPDGTTRGWEWYIIRGGLQDWAYHWHGEHHVTIEVADAQPPAYNQMDAYWNDNRDAMLWWLERALTGAHGRVTDASTGAPLDATIDVLEIGKPVRTDAAVGDYHRLLLPGTYTLAASAGCHLPAQAVVTIPSAFQPAAAGDGAAVQDFALAPDPACRRVYLPMIARP